jgi:CRISPR-associated protein Csb2
MSRVADVLQSDELPTFFTGHADSSEPVKGVSHDHLFYLALDADGDGRLDHVAIVAPHLADRTTNPSPSRRHRHSLAKALESLTTVRAGTLGVMTLSRVAEAPSSVLGPSREWESHTPYRPTRHPKAGRDADEAMIDDIRLECMRRGLPAPMVTVLESIRGPKGGFRCRARLLFKTPVSGPIMLGAGSHFGDGLFSVAGRSSNDG